LAVGDYVPIAASETVLQFERRHAGRRLLIALNFSPDPQPIDLAVRPKRLLLSTYLNEVQEPGISSVLRSNEGGIFEVQ
jgi:alpha-glucosidase